jgi:DNA-binding transcriptional LysR family regulator
MERDDLNVLSAFLAVAEARSFTQAAKRLSVSQPALSHAIRGLEEDIGVRLLSRTTRSVAPTDAGDELLRSVGPALTDIRAALDKVSGMRGKPTGRVRLVVSPLAAGSMIRRYARVGTRTEARCVRSQLSRRGARHHDGRKPS